MHSKMRVVDMRERIKRRQFTDLVRLQQLSNLCFDANEGFEEVIGVFNDDLFEGRFQIWVDVS